MPRSPNRVHDRTSFFKYMPASTARIVLSKKTMRWSSPVRFNDPFDTPRDMASGVKPVDVAKTLEQRLAALLQLPPPDTSRLSPRVRFLVEAARLAPPDVRSEVVNAMKLGSTDQQPSGTSLDELRAMWRTFIPAFRILCLTEDPASASMWHHYADAMKGTVIEVACVDDLDSPWLKARQVTYDTRSEDMFNASELADILLMPQRVREETMLHWATFRKSPEWSYEKEWRVVYSKRMPATDEYTDFPFHPEELSGVYLGPYVEAADREALIALARSFPRVRVVQVEIGRGLQFKDLPL